LQDRFTLLKTEVIKSGLPGTPGISRQKKYSVIPSYILSIGHDERLSRNNRYI
jgi:hypothetical protein